LRNEEEEEEEEGGCAMNFELRRVNPIYQRKVEED